MDKAKAAVSGFLSKDGKHDTTVHETINPAVQNERVTRTQHENAQTVVDREVHQDHHHTSVQPIHDREVLPEQHSHNMAATEHRSIKHGDDSHVKERLAAEAQQFKNTKTVGDTQHTSSAAPVLAGEHVHHHVHENIQPVVQKETVQPSVVHTTIPIHEVHQNESKHHTATQLPPVSMADFKSQGGGLGGREERTDAFAGEPKAVGGTLGGHGAKGSTSLTEGDGGNSYGTRSSQNTGSTGTTGTRGTSGSYGNTGTGAAGTAGSSTGLSGSGTHGSTGSTGSTQKKASFMDKLNPKVDSDGDGKAGFMK